MKKKVCECFQIKWPDLRHADCDWSTFTLRGYVLLQLDQAVDGVSGETDRMLSSQVTQHHFLWEDLVLPGGWEGLLGDLRSTISFFKNRLSYIQGRKAVRCTKHLTGFGVNKGFAVQHHLQKFMSVHKEDPPPPNPSRTPTVLLSPKLLTCLRLAQITAGEGEKKGRGFLSF